MKSSTLIHPVRYMRNRPFARRVTQMYMSMGGRRGPTSKALELITDVVVRYFNDAIKKRPFEQRPARATRLLSEESSLAAHVAAYVAHGRNTFLLSPELVAMLDRTELDGVRAADINLPFDVFYISFGDAFEACLPGPPNKIDGAYINQTGSLPLQVLITSRRADVQSNRSNDWPFSRDRYFYAPLDNKDRERTLGELVAAAVEKGEIQLKAELPKPENDNFHESEIPGLYVCDVRHETEKEHVEYIQQGLGAFRRALALAMNAICYMTATSDEQRTPSYPEDAPADLVRALESVRPAERQRANAKLLDQGYVPIYFLRDENRVRTPAEQTGREVSTHWRRGHWRRQAAGPGRATRLLRWIRPTLVRADKGDATTGHIYHAE